MSELRVEHVHKAFPTPSGPLVILEDVDLALETGQSAAVLGPSGSGKSTLLHIIGTLDRPTSGRVTLGDVDLHALSRTEAAAFRNRSIGFVFQDHILLPELTVLENILVPAMAEGAVSEADWQRAETLMERVGLAARRDHRPAALSGGERGRVALARALVRRPQLVLADEPTGNLDRKTASVVLDLLLELQREEGTMLLVVTHDVALARRVQKRYELQEGKLVPVS